MRSSSISLIANHFLPDLTMQASGGTKVVSIIDGDTPGSTRNILDFICSTEWPVIILSKNCTVRLSTKYIRAGALDYIDSVTCRNHLVAKCMNIFRLMDRTYIGDITDDTNEVLSIDYRRRIIHGPGGDSIGLTVAEITLLSLLVRHRDRCITRDELLSQNITGNNTNYHSLNVLIGRLRTKLRSTMREQIIESVRGSGYIIRKGARLVAITD